MAICIPKLHRDYTGKGWGKTWKQKRFCIILKLPEDISESRYPSLVKCYQWMSECTAGCSMNHKTPLTFQMGDKNQQDNLTYNNFVSLEFPFTIYNKGRGRKGEKANQKMQTITHIWQTLVFRHRETKSTVECWFRTFLLSLVLFLFINFVLVSPVVLYLEGLRTSRCLHPCPANTTLQPGRMLPWCVSKTTATKWCQIYSRLPI